MESEHSPYNKTAHQEYMHNANCSLESSRKSDTNTDAIRSEDKYNIYENIALIQQYSTR